MNQLRSRRFIASKKSAESSSVREECASDGEIVPSETPVDHHFISNCTMQGTLSSQRLSHCLQFYIHERLNNDLRWRIVKVILSDANVPGEGKHKIMSYIRNQRAHLCSNSETHHVVFGLDADLIMLGLATHEPNFTIIREEILSSNSPHSSTETQFILFRLRVLKEYLIEELDMPNHSFP